MYSRTTVLCKQFVMAFKGITTATFSVEESPIVAQWALTVSVATACGANWRILMKRCDWLPATYCRLRGVRQNVHLNSGHYVGLYRVGQIQRYEPTTRL